MPRLILDFKNETREVISKKFLKEIILELLKKKKISGIIEIGLLIVKEDKMKDLNLKYRKIDKSSSILSFPVFESFTKSKMPFHRDLNIPILLGDIIICPGQIKKSCTDEFENQLQFLIRHGLLHLLGYHH